MSPAASWRLAGNDDIVPGLAALDLIGGGNAYEAYLAFDERLYAPAVAKVIRPDQVDEPSVRADFEREVAMLQRINHPGVVRLFGVQRSGDRPHLVLEHIDGPTLSKLIATHGPIQLAQLLPLGVELASALHYLHENGICHLDIKPSNIIMGAPAKLIDFSIARDIGEAAALDHVLGSDEYMAPEQCCPGELGVIGPPADIWAVGATLFRAAAGYRAFDRDRHQPQVEEEPYALPDFVPGVVQDVIMWCLAKEPAARPTPVDLAEAIGPIMARLPKARLSGFRVAH